MANAGILFAANNDQNQLITVDTNTLAVTTIGSFGIDVSFGGMAYDGNTDTLYLVGGRRNNNLYSVNQSTGAATLIGSHGIEDLFGLAFDSLNNVLYASQFCCQPTLDLFSLDTITGAATNIGALNPGMGGLAYNSKTDQLIGIRDGAGDLYAIDRTNAATTLLADPLGSVNDSGLTYDPDLDIFWDFDFNGNLVSFDPNNGYAVTTHISVVGFAVDGLAYKTGPNVRPVPEPSSLILAGLGLAAIGRMRRSRA